MFMWDDDGLPTAEDGEGGRGWAVAAFILIVGLLLVFSPWTVNSASAQNNPAAVRIADAAQPSKFLFEDNCMAVNAPYFRSGKETAKYCLDLRALEVKRETKLANEAADASKNNHPNFGNAFLSNNGGLAGAYAPGFVPGGGPGGVNIYSAGTGGNGGRNCSFNSVNGGNCR